MTTGTKRWRTLVRVTGVDGEGKRATVVVPAWRHDEFVDVDLESMPADVREAAMVPGARLHAMVALGAESPEGLEFGGWEPR